jgi:hypothetical protein
METNHALMIVPGRRQARRESWTRILAEWDRSGQSGVEFAAERRIDVRGLYRWRRRVRHRATLAARPGLIELPPVAVAAWAAEVATGSGTVRLSPVASPRWAAQLIRELSQC